MHWLLEPTALELMLRARRECVDVAAALSWEEQQSTASSDRPRNLTVAGSTAQIAIEGVLTKKPDFFALFFGGGNTTYSTIRQALATAEMDPTIKDVVLHIDSPGGSVDGLFETLDAIHLPRGLEQEAPGSRGERSVGSLRHRCSGGLHRGRDPWGHLRLHRHGRQLPRPRRRRHADQ